MTRTCCALGLPQPIVAADIGLRFLTQRERGRRRHVWLISWLSIHKPVKQVQHMGLVGTPASSAISTAQSTACSSCCKTKDKISTIHPLAGYCAAMSREGPDHHPACAASNLAIVGRDRAFPRTAHRSLPGRRFEKQICRERRSAPSLRCTTAR
jgi:hypothetical protein